MTTVLSDPELEARIRAALTAVSETVNDEPSPLRPRATAVSSDRHPSRRLVVAAAGGLSALALAAFAYLPTGSEYVQELPPADAISRGVADGIQFWLVPSFHTDVCNLPGEGVELISGATNKVGMEWNTGVLAYGDPTEARPGCSRFDQKAWLADPTRTAITWTRLGNDNEGPWAGMIAVHPSATTIVIIGPDQNEQRIPALPRQDAPAGPRYAAFGLPEDAVTVTITVLDTSDKQLTSTTQKMPEPPWGSPS